jgi:uncharacterized OsmC-like protein
MSALTSVIDATQAAVEADPLAAAFTFDAEATLVGVTEVDVRTGQHSFKVDEPPLLGGGDVAANPVQLTLAALGACQAITYQFWATKLGITLDGIEVRTEGDLDLHGFFGLDDSTRPGFLAVRLFVSVRGPEPAERYEELGRAVDQHCPVLDIVTNPVPVQRTLTVE